jgi:hypothetical protein
MLRKRWKKFSEQITEKYRGYDIRLISNGANFFGLESLGAKQVRGNGILLLIADALIFEQWVPNRTIKISLNQVKEIAVVKSHIGKTKGVPLIKVNFQGTGGISDSAAWWVQDLDKWEHTLRLYSLKEEF